MTDNFIITPSDLDKLEKLVSQLDGDKQKEFFKILHNLSHPLVFVTPDIDCPPEKILVDRRKFEDMLQDLNKQHFEE